jgi:hypothetical protein
MMGIVQEMHSIQAQPQMEADDTLPENMISQCHQLTRHQLQSLGSSKYKFSSVWWGSYTLWEMSQFEPSQIRVSTVVATTVRGKYRNNKQVRLFS